jgi:hypothetical protein
MKHKERLSASIDADLLAAAEHAVSRGEAPTVSSWVNDAIRLKMEHDRRLKELESFIREHEDEHGVITPAEMREATRRARARAVSARASEPVRQGARRRGR